jgi:uncharacterized protein DUF1778
MMPVMRENRFEMLIPPELLTRVEEWRQGQTVPPTRAAAMRFLIERGLMEGLEIIRVSDEEWDHFMGVMNNPAGPSPALRKLLLERC